MTNFHQIARDLFEVAVRRADPATALREALDLAPLPPLKNGGKNIIVAVGKAAVPMMQEALSLIPEPRTSLVVTNPENNININGVTVMLGSHPVPDEHSQKAGKAVIDLVQSATKHDRVIALISGGGSALAVAPAPGLTITDKAVVNTLLLNSGLSINDMNLIRQQLSDLKGGGLLRHAAPAQVHAFILSDVIGDDLRAIASGPTTAPIGSRADARRVMQEANIWDGAPKAVQTHLNAFDTLVEDPIQATNTLIGSNRHSLQAMRQATPQPINAHIVSDHLVGDVAQAAETIVAAAQTMQTDTPVALIFGGETTVQITGTGLGGRNQELALRVALLAQSRLAKGWCFLSGGTDGRDGPTDAAGGIVDADTVRRIQDRSGNVLNLLKNNDSYAALEMADALLVTGGTGTNVADVQVMMLPAK